MISAKSSSTRHEFTQDFSKISPTARARSPTAVHGTWLEENSPPAGERAPRITPDSFPGSAGCAPGSPAPASAASRRLARSHAGRSTASGAWEAAALPCAARSSLAHGCVATSEHHGGHAHVLILRHAAPRLAHALGRLAAGGAAKRTKQIAQVFRSQHKNSRFRSLCDSGAPRELLLVRRRRDAPGPPAAAMR